MDDTIRKPVNKTAKVVTGPSWDDYSPKKKNNKRELWNDPPPTKPIPGTIKNMVGFQKGRLTVVGYLGFKNKVKNRITKDGKQYTENMRLNKWLVRCTCGRYEIRTQQSLTRKRTAHLEDMCQICQDLHFKTDKNYLKNAFVEVRLIHLSQHSRWVAQTLNIRKKTILMESSKDKVMQSLQDILTKNNIIGKPVVVEEEECYSFQEIREPSKKVVDCYRIDPITKENTVEPCIKPSWCTYSMEGQSLSCWGTGQDEDYCRTCGFYSGIKTREPIVTPPPEFETIEEALANIDDEF